MSSVQRNFLSTEATVRALLLEQLGLITVTQARGAGMSPPAISRRVRSGRWIHVHPGVYRDVMVPDTLEQSAFAALLWAGTDAVVNRETAGALWSLDGVAAGAVQLWTPRRLRSDVVVVHRGEVALNDRRMLGPLTLTSPARTLVDLAAVLDDEDLTAVVEDAIHRGLTTPMSIAR